MPERVFSYLPTTLKTATVPRAEAYLLIAAFPLLGLFIAVFGVGRDRAPFRFTLGCLANLFWLVMALAIFE